MENSSLTYAPSHRWARFTASAIDLLFIALILLLFYPLSQQIEEFGPYARIPTILIACSYFGVLESGERLTLGRKIMHLRLRRLDHKPISFLFAFCRAALILIPFYIDFISPIFPRTPIMDDIHLLSVTAVEAAYCIVPFFHPQGRTLTDLIFGTWVSARSDTETARPIGFGKNRLIAFVVATIAIAGTITALFMIDISKHTVNTAESERFKTISERLQDKTHLEVPTIAYSIFTINDKRTMYSLDATVLVPMSTFRDDLKLEVLKSQIFPIMRRDVDNPEVDTVRVIFVGHRQFGLLSKEVQKIEGKKIVDVDVAQDP